MRAVVKSTSNLAQASKLLAVGFFERLYLIKWHTVAVSGLMELILYVRDLVRSHLAIHYACGFISSESF